MALIIRKCEDTDCKTVSELFYQTVHAVNARDYSTEQLFAWAGSATSLTQRQSDLLKQYTLVAELYGKITGFGSIDKSGYLDLLFVHKDFQSQGIATALCNELEKAFVAVKTYASVTAKSFFERRGYAVIAEHEAERAGVKLKNYEMLLRK